MSIRSEPEKESTEKSKMWRIPQLHDVELLHARFVSQNFANHAHDTYAIGVIEQGAMKFDYRGGQEVAAAGQINLCIPGEVHNGQAAVAQGWQYRMFYLKPEWLQQAASLLNGRARPIPFFASGTIQDPALAAMLQGLHCSLEQPDYSLLEQESRLLWTFAQMIGRHADEKSIPRRLTKEPTAVRQIKQYIDMNYSRNFSLNELSRLTHLSPFHLIRVFKAVVGQPPHAYLRQVRLQRAKQLLAAGESIADTAVRTGFSDQSHLTRWFKRTWGATPGQYRNNVQDWPH